MMDEFGFTRASDSRGLERRSIIWHTWTEGEVSAFLEIQEVKYGNKEPGTFFAPDACPF